MQNTTRNGPLYLPTSATPAEIANCQTIFSDLKAELEHYNPYVHDFLQICDIPIDQLDEAAFVISEKHVPPTAGPRT